MPTNNSMNFAKMFSAMTKIFQKADPEAMRDLSDAIDAPTFADQFNRPDHGNTPRTMTGPAEAMSGSGAEKFVTDYSKDTAQNGLTQAYATMAAELASTSKRVESVEKGLTAIAGLLSQMVKGERFPEDETKPDERGEEDGDTEEDESASSKSALPVHNIPSLMRSLSGASRQTLKTGLNPGPNLATVAKARLSDADRYAAMAEQAYEAGNAKDGLHYQSLAMRHRVASNGVAVDSRLLAGTETNRLMASGHVAGTTDAQRRSVIG